ncbi:MAG: hypothetical protein RRY34_09630 [Victivallaceae bacterium]
MNDKDKIDVDALLKHKQTESRSDFMIGPEEFKRLFFKKIEHRKLERKKFFRNVAAVFITGIFVACVTWGGMKMSQSAVEHKDFLSNVVDFKLFLANMVKTVEVKDCVQVYSTSFTAAKSATLLLTGGEECQSNMGGNCNVKLDNTMELFGSDVALMFVNDELIIGERHGNGEDLRRWRLKVEDPASHQKYTLLVAGAENFDFPK